MREKKTLKTFFKKLLTIQGGVWYHAHVIRNRKKNAVKKSQKKLYKNPKKGLTTSKDYGIIYIEEGISRNRRLLPPPPNSPRLQRAAHAGVCDMRIVNTKKSPQKN